MVKSLLLAGKVVSTASVAYPVYASPKLDGIRAAHIGNELLSRKFIAIPNLMTQACFSHEAYADFDGELIVGEPNDKDVYNNTYRGVMSIDGDPSAVYYVFDLLNDARPFSERYEALKAKAEGLSNVVVVPHRLVHSEAELLAFEEDVLSQGYEGVMVRSPDGKYKEGRSTTKEGILLKLKRFEDAEAEVIGFEPLYKNQNEATTDNLGHTKRSSNAEGLVVQDTLGALFVRDLKSGVEFNIGSGFSVEVRKFIWDNRKRFLGQIIIYKHFTIGVVNKPRFPIYKGIRDRGDM